MLNQILIAIQLIEGAAIIALFLKHKEQATAISEHSESITELVEAPEPPQPVVFSDHVVCTQCHSVVARYNPQTGICANCDSKGFLESRNGK